RDELRGLDFKCAGYPVRHLIDPGAAIRCQLFVDGLRTRLPVLSVFGSDIIGRQVWNPEHSQSDCDKRSDRGENKRGEDERPRTLAAEEIDEEPAHSVCIENVAIPEQIRV